MLHVWGSLNSSNMWTGSLVWVWSVLIRRCRQREPAKPAIRIERFSNSILNVKIYSHIREVSFSGFAGFVATFFPFFHDYIFLSAAKSPRATFCHFCSHVSLFLLDSTWNLLRNELKKKRLSSSAGSLFLVPFFLPASADGSTAKQRYLKLAQVSLLADWFIVYLAIVVTYSYSFTTFQTEYFWSSLGNCVEY